MLEAKLLHKKTNKKCKGCKDGGIYQNLWPIPLSILVVFFQLHHPLPPFSSGKNILKNAVCEEWSIPVCLEDNDKNLG